ncbi:MAG: response regulator, partial [Verrucomicrobiae bacterium]|nr:response regulator [Verrucomicrobiae bacterium]
MKAGSILVVEDDADIAASLEMILDGEGYSVTICGDGAAALRVAGEESFDLVLTDFRLPRMGGLELMERLRETQPQRPVILMTAHGSTDLAIEATKRGAFDYLLKPFDIGELMEVVGKAMRASRTMLRKV